MWLLLMAFGPSDLAPGAPELLAAERELRALLISTRATGAATSRLQVAWTLGNAPKEACADPARLEVGWRIERFGAAWREATQAARAQAERVRRIRAAPTVSPLVDARWARQLEDVAVETDRQAAAVMEASTWETLYVRPELGACPVPAVGPAPGVAMLQAPVRDEAPLPVAVLALGDGWICPGAVRADDAVVLVDGGLACWSPSEACGCVPEAVEPGAVLGASPAPAEPDAP